MVELPKRVSLIEQVAESLRLGIQRGEWSDGLPAERKLSDLLQVSRPTLRESLHLLEREGLLRVSEKNGRRLPVPQRRTARTTRPKLVGFVTSERFDDLAPSDLSHLYQLRRHLQDAGVGLEVTADTRLKKRTPNRVLEETVRQVQAGCWVLHHASERVQRWCADRKLPVIVMGSCHAGTGFPSLDWDYGAVGRDAATLLLSLGHRRIAILNPQSGLAGDQARERGFLDAIQGTRTANASPAVLRHNGSPEHIQRLLLAALQSPAPPTAVFVSESMHALDVLTLLMRERKRVPQDVSLVSGDRENFLAHVTPLLACYQPNWNTYAERLSHLAVQLIRTGVSPRRATLLTPRFQRGESLAPPPP